MTQITFLGLFVFVVLQVFRNLKKKNLKEDIATTEARIANLRLNLKTRVKKKSQQFRVNYPKNLAPGDPVDTAIAMLSSIDFEKNDDFESYIELSKKINGFIKLANAPKEAEDDSTPKFEDNSYNDFIGTDIKNELNIVRIINDLVSISKTLQRQVTKFNHLERKNKVPYKEVISFPSYFELQRVLHYKQDSTTHNGFHTNTENTAKVA